MNLNKLKELEAKTTKERWSANEHPNELYWSIVNKKTQYQVADGCDKNNAHFICAFRNQAKEMIETIERYKAALEKLKKKYGWDFDDKMVIDASPVGSGISETQKRITRIIDNALKEPEKTS